MSTAARSAVRWHLGPRRRSRHSPHLCTNDQETSSRGNKVTRKYITHNHHTSDTQTHTHTLVQTRNCPREQPSQRKKEYLVKASSAVSLVRTQCDAARAPQS